MSQHAHPRRAVPLPRTWPLRPGDLLALAAGNGLLIVGMWVRHGGFPNLGSAAADLTAAGQLTALLGTYLALIGILLMSRSAWLEQLVGLDRLAVWHHWVGFACLWLLLGHAALTTAGYAMSAGSSLGAEAWTLLTTYPYMVMATVGLGLLIVVAVASIRYARRRLAYETWYGLHLYAYLAVALAFAHVLAVGTDFFSDPVAQLYWVGLYVFVVACLLYWRVGQPLRLSLHHRLRVANVVQEAPGVVSVYVTGRQLDQLAARAGQFFLWRFLAGGGWWRPHPFSLSAAPNGRFLRLTIKDSGDDTRLFQRLRPGVPVFAEGPYGSFTGARRGRQRALLVAGGIGITPLRALLEEFPPARNAVTLLYRASSWDEVVFREELDVLAKARGATVRYLVGRRGTPEMPGDPLDARSLRQLVPDVRGRDVFLCGPEAMMASVREALGALGVPASQIHAERFAF